MTNETPVLPSEEYEAHVIEFAIQELLMQESRELEETPLTPEEEEVLQLAERSRQKRLAQIDKAITRHNRINRFKTAASTMLKYAATIALIASFSFGTALAVSPEFRVTMIELLTIVTDEYVNVGPERNTSKAGIPSGWMAEYFPGYVPEGYELAYCHSEDHLSKAVFMNSTGKSITYTVSANKMTLQVNAENALCHMVSIGDCTAYLYTMDNLSMITWHDGKQYHTLTASTSEYVLDVVESLVVASNRGS